MGLIKCARSEKRSTTVNCTQCGKKGHLEYNCWGNCPVCGELGHKPGSCQLSPEKIKTIARKRRKIKKWDKVRKRKTQLPVPESSGQYWAESLSDSETVIEKEDSSGETSEEEEMSEGVKRVKEVIGDATLEDISAAIKNIKKAKENDNSTMGMISKTTDFRKAKEERLLMDSGAPD